ncbi:MAG: hypothetical protein P8I79_10565 [Amylibacter sp.]|nr:hypothetical protein [Amylibacter sp.]
MAATTSWYRGGLAFADVRHQNAVCLRVLVGARMLGVLESACSRENAKVASERGVKTHPIRLAMTFYALHDSGGA